MCMFFFFKQKTAYEMRISDWSSDVCSSDFMTESPTTPILVQRRVMVGGDSLTDAQPAFDGRTGEPVVNFRFDSTGGRTFGEVTRNNVGKRSEERRVGKECVLRVDLGGRRTITNKKK